MLGQASAWLHFGRGWEMKVEPAFVTDTSSLAVNVWFEEDCSEENEVVIMSLYFFKH